MLATGRVSALVVLVLLQLFVGTVVVPLVCIYSTLELGWVASSRCHHKQLLGSWVILVLRPPPIYMRALL